MPTMPTPSLDDLRIKVFADGADLEDIRRAAADPLIKGFTTNPTLMRKANVPDYADFAHAVLAVLGDKPVSFEVFADDFDEMETQAREIASWGDNVFVKIPVTDTAGTFAGPLINRLSTAGVQVNVTATMTPEQVERIADSLDPHTPAIVSVFAGRIADSGRDPVPLMVRSLEILAARPEAELLWASPREVLNLLQADAIGCHIITMTHDLLAKLGNVGKELEQFSLETVEMFHRDAVAAAYSIGAAAVTTSTDP